MLQPMPIGQPIFTTEKNLDALFGFVLAKVESPQNQKIPTLPYRCPETGRLICPTGIWHGWYFTEELRDARDNYGYNVEILKGYTFEKSTNLFQKYVEYFYEIKANSTGVQREIAKLMLNSLYGRFGMHEFI